MQASLDQAYKQAVSDIDDYVKREWSAEERSNRTEDIQKMKQFVGQEAEALLNAIEKAKTVTDLGKLGEKFSENPQKWYEDALQQIIR